MMEVRIPVEQTRNTAENKLFVEHLKGISPHFVMQRFLKTSVWEYGTPVKGYRLEANLLQDLVNGVTGQHLVWDGTFQQYTVPEPGTLRIKTYVYNGPGRYVFQKVETVKGDPPPFMQPSSPPSAPPLHPSVKPLPGAIPPTNVSTPVHSYVILTDGEQQQVMMIPPGQGVVIPKGWRVESMQSDPLVAVTPPPLAAVKQEAITVPSIPRRSRPRRRTWKPLTSHPWRSA